MSKPTVSDLEFLAKEVVLAFYQVKRHVPLRFEPGRRENDAEHSWSLALFACALAPHIDKKLDVGKICQYATVHDLVEVYAGDTSNFASAEKKATKEQRERLALERLRQELTAFPWIVEAATDYEEQQTPESNYVRSVDKLLPLLFDYMEEGLFYHENKITIEQWKEHLQKHRQKAGVHAGAFEYYDQLWNLLLANPHFFYDPMKTLKK
jgi:5'-deoxynucleotidase YfbR-like HD superfamily hydrolase